MDFSIEDVVNSLTLRNKLLLHHLMTGKQTNIDLIFDLCLIAFFGHGKFWHAILHSGVLFRGCTQQLSFHHLLSSFA
jgi:G:T-mismatch repair DNA endonuclease (very short patch repair protein)